MKTVEEILLSIKIDKDNLIYCAGAGILNGSILVSFKNAMQQYANLQSEKLESINKDLRNCLDIQDINVVKFKQDIEYWKKRAENAEHKFTMLLCIDNKSKVLMDKIDEEARIFGKTESEIKAFETGAEFILNLIK